MTFSKVVIRIFGLALLPAACLAQAYPWWFLNQGDLPCPGATVGITATPYYPDSTGGQGLMLAAQNAVRYRAMTISGSKAYFTSEEGTTVLGSTVAESFDTTLVETTAKNLKVLATYSHHGLTIVLASSSGCDVSEQFQRMVRVDRPESPAWTNTLPRDESMWYALGISESFYYEQSSWTEAEKNARLELARMSHSRMRGVEYTQRNESGVSAGTSTRDEDLGSTNLFGVRVMRRWRNPSSNLFYVLLGMPR